MQQHYWYLDIKRLKTQNLPPLSDNQTKAYMNRSVFELNNRQHINVTLNSMCSVENPEVQKSLS
jgi:hypothetical protein